MIVLRRHLIAVTWAILGLYAQGAALSAAAVCRGQEHTHGGAPAPDCAMHHQHAQTLPEPGSHHGHHGAAGASGAADSETVDSGTAARLSCRCSGDLLTVVLGQLAVLPSPPSRVPAARPVALEILDGSRSVDRWYPPPSPPPR